MCTIGVTRSVTARHLASKIGRARQFASIVSMNVLGLIAKLRGVEASLLKRGEYVERFDALSLSTVASPEELEASPGNAAILAAASSHPQMVGLGKLVSALSLVLNEANVDQQSHLLSLKNELEQCTQTLASFPEAAEFMHGDHYLDASISSDNIALSSHSLSSSSSSSSSSSNSSSSSSSTSSSSSSSSSSNLFAWDRIPSAEDDPPRSNNNSNNSSIMNSSNNTADASRRRAEMVAFKHLQKRIQDVHDACSLLLDAKLCAHEVINSCMEGYVRIISLLAHEANISYATTRAVTIVRPQTNILLSHRFLDTKEVHELIGMHS